MSAAYNCTIFIEIQHTNKEELQGVECLRCMFGGLDSIMAAGSPDPDAVEEFSLSQQPYILVLQCERIKFAR